MRNKLLLVIVSMLLTSCATVFSKKEYKMQVSSNAPNASVKVYGKDYKLPASITVKRSKDDLKLIFINDSLQKEMSLRSRLTPNFIYGNFFFGSPISYAIDLDTEKRFYYKNDIYIKVKDTSVTITKVPFSNRINDIFKPSMNDETGKVRLHISFPLVNNFNFSPKDENRIAKYYAFGISGGLDYFYNKNSFISFQIDEKGTFKHRVPTLKYDDVGKEIRVGSVNYSISNNRKLNKFSYGYGLNYAENYWIYSAIYYNPTSPNLILNYKKTINRNLGLHLNSYFQVTNSFFFGVVYQPSIVNLNFGQKFQYEHSLSLDFGWKIDLFNTKKSKWE